MVDRLAPRDPPRDHGQERPDADLRAVDREHHDVVEVRLPEEDADGITAYRNELSSIVASLPRQSLLHEEIIRKLDKSAETFHVLILKTNMRLPYTSVFMELDCGYWTPEAEQRLRERMRRVVPSPSRS